MTDLRSTPAATPAPPEGPAPSMVRILAYLDTFTDMRPAVGANPEMARLLVFVALSGGNLTDAARCFGAPTSTARALWVVAGFGPLVSLLTANGYAGTSRPDLNRPQWFADVHMRVVRPKTRCRYVSVQGDGVAECGAVINGGTYCAPHKAATAPKAPARWGLSPIASLGL